MLRPTFVALALAAVACASSPPAPSTPEPPAVKTAPPARPLDDHLAALVMRLNIDDVEVRAAAARELGSMGGAAAPALPELITCAATEPREGGGYGGELDPGHLPDTEPVALCAAAIASISAGDPDALVAALAVPLAIKERALAALLDAGAAAVPGAAAVYLDACARADAATDPTVHRHLTATADAALAVLAINVDLARDALAGDAPCATRGVARVRTLASHR